MTHYIPTPVEEVVDELVLKYLELHPDQRIGVDYVAAEIILDLRNQVKKLEESLFLANKDIKKELE
jgi:hypothetical protein